MDRLGLRDDRVFGAAFRGAAALLAESQHSSLRFGSAASILADKMFQFLYPNAFAISSRASVCVVSIAFAFKASRRARAIAFASRKSRIRAPFHRRTEKIGACFADPFANDMVVSWHQSGLSWGCPAEFHNSRSASQKLAVSCTPLSTDPPADIAGCALAGVAAPKKKKPIDLKAITAVDTMT
jgi:hypothetical protein